jgi:hypothetical protein
MHPRSSTPILALLLASIAHAQGGVAPPDHAEAWGNGCNLLPYNNTYHRWHQLYEAAVLPTTLTVGKKIVAVGWRRCGDLSTYSAGTIDLEVSIFSVPLTQATMTTTFATNRAAGTGGVAFARKVVNLPAMPFGNPGNTFHLLMLDTPHTFAGPNLLIETVATDTASRSTGWRADMCIGSTGGAAANFAAGCGPTANTMNSTSAPSGYLPGATITITETSGPPSLPATNFVGLSATSLAGVPLPLSLAGLGATGCNVYTSAFFTFPKVLDAAGAASIAVGVPSDPAFTGIKFNSQWINLHPAAPGGISVSAPRRFVIGPVNTAMAYLYRLSDNLDTTGSKFTNRGQVLRLLY